MFLAAALVFVGVNVVPMDTERVVRDQTVIVEGARVTAIGPVESVVIPAGTSLHDELAELLAAGLKPYEALSAANPLENPATLRNPAEVVLRGQWIPYARRRAVRP